MRWRSGFIAWAAALSLSATASARIPAFGGDISTAAASAQSAQLERMGHQSGAMALAAEHRPTPAKQVSDTGCRASQPSKLGLLRSSTTVPRGTSGDCRKLKG